MYSRTFPIILYYSGLPIQLILFISSEVGLCTTSWSSWCMASLLPKRDALGSPQMQWYWVGWLYQRSPTAWQNALSPYLPSSPHSVVVCVRYTQKYKKVHCVTLCSWQLSFMRCLCDISIKVVLEENYICNNIQSDMNHITIAYMYLLVFPYKLACLLGFWWAQ